MLSFILKQFKDISTGGFPVIFIKVIQLGKVLQLWVYKFSCRLISVLYAIPIVFLMRVLSPLILIRTGRMHSLKIGHYSGNIEIYLCKKDLTEDKNKRNCFDIFFNGYDHICNSQLELMWKRILRIWPRALVSPVDNLNRLIPGGEKYLILADTDRDEGGILPISKIHLAFTDEEELIGKNNLRNMGIPEGSKYVCINIRDSAYLTALGQENDDDSYRNTEVNDYILAIKALVDMGIYVIRMGAKVHSSINFHHPLLIDYAANGMRNEFMDIYLPSKCFFCVSTGTGWECVPATLFRRPMCYVNFAPLGYLCIFFSDSISITKKYYSLNLGREMTISEIFEVESAYFLKTHQFRDMQIRLINNSPEEIRDLVVEKCSRLLGTWKESDEDCLLQSRFQELFKRKVAESEGRHLHSSYLGRFGSRFLRDNDSWIS